ncbi:efflux RND transporter periplasmic adaptor subunit [Litorimonas haliclonae]|uniref:efflux RND transporter periplasmic adaptor subunit n=1 Tax=Litorimonas haliclonae TaxID=2081977 RepID=UPI0039F111A1
MTQPQTVGAPEQNEKYPKFRAFVFSILVLVALGVATFIWIKVTSKPEEKERTFNSLAVMGARAFEEDVTLRVQTQGEVQPLTEIDLVPEVGGKIVYVSPNFIEGGFFKKGETLIRIDDSNFKISKIRAQATIAQAEQVLAREIAEGEIAKSDFEELGRGEPSALAMRLPQRQEAEASLLAAKADLESANLQLSRTNVRAPFDGRVRTKSSDVGQFVSAGSPLGRIFSTNIVQVRLPLTDADLAKVDLPIAFNAASREAAPKVMLSTNIAGQRQEWTGYIMRTDSTYDTQSRALFAIVEVFDPYGKGASQNGVPLAPGLFVDAMIEGKKLENVIVLSRDGLRPQNEVYVVDEKGNAEVRKATVADSDATRAVITSGVEPGDLVVVSPLERSRIATPLKVLDINNPQTVIVDPPRPDWMKQSGDSDENSGDESETQESDKTAGGNSDKTASTSESSGGSE